MDLVVETERLRQALDDLQRALEAERQRADTERERAEMERQRAEVAETAARRLQLELDLLLRKLVGPSSERVVDPNQLPLPVKGAEPPPVPAREADPEPGGDSEPKGERRTKRTRNRRNIEDMNHLRTEVHHEQHTPACPCGCGAKGVVIGQDVSWRLERVPAEIVRHKNIRDRFAFPEHRERVGDGTPAPIWTAPPPFTYALPGALCGDGLLVSVVIDKYCDHLPLYRQSKRFEREGLDLSRQTLCDWMMEFGALLLPIVKVLSAEVLAGVWLRADATGMPVMDETRTKGKAHHGHLWAWGNYDTVVFTYTPDKKAPTVAALFPDFQGVVLIDGATDFNLLERREGVTRAGCWAHARRLFYDAMPSDALLASRGLAAIRQLFVAERVVMAAPVDERLALRDELCRPILAGIRNWVDEELPRAVPGFPMHRALQYLDNQWDRLCVFLEHAAIACHNNDSERDLRRPVKGKANYHFAGSPRGAHAAAVFYTLIGTCLLQGIDPRRYLLEVVRRLDEPPTRLTPQAIRLEWLEAAKPAAA
jgi:transposase